MAIHEPDRIWWNPLSKDERIWVILALIWMVGTFLFMPIWHIFGTQNPPNETYSVKADDYDKLVEGMVAKYKVGEEQGMPVVHPNPNEPVYVRARMWEWYPVLELEKGKTYRIHLSSMDIQHGFSIQPINMNFMALPGYDYVLKLTPTSSGEFHIICNEYCGLGHHTMVGKMYVKG